MLINFSMMGVLSFDFSNDIAPCSVRQSEEILIDKIAGREP
jgi:hypothetical protein